MKKIKYLIALLVMVVLFCVVGNTKVEATYQDEVEQIGQNESELSKFFDKEIVGYVIEFVVAFGATAMAVASFIKTFKNVTGSFDKSADKNEETKKELIDAKETILKDNEKTKKAIEEDNAKTRQELETIKKAIVLAFTNDEKLVKKGVAIDIASMLGSDEDGQTN